MNSNADFSHWQERCVTAPNPRVLSNLKIECAISSKELSLFCRQKLVGLNIPESTELVSSNSVVEGDRFFRLNLKYQTGISQR